MTAGGILFLALLALNVVCQCAFWYGFSKRNTYSGWWFAGAALSWVSALCTALWN